MKWLDPHFQLDLAPLNPIGILEQHSSVFVATASHQQSASGS